MSMDTVRNLKKWIYNIIPGEYDYQIEPEQTFDVFNLELDVSSFNSLNKNRLQLIDFSDEPWLDHTCDVADMMCRKVGLTKYLILSRDLQYYKNPSWPNILYFPHNYYDPLIFWNINSGIAYSKICERKYFISCLNRSVREHRIYNYKNLMKKKFYIGNSLITLYNSDTSLYSDNPSNLTDPELKTYWENIRLNLPRECINDLNFNNDAYTNSYINLVTETSVTLGNHFFTEKIYKPLATGQFFLLIGTPGSIEVLRSMGFDTYDDIIDHSRYDFISDWKERIDAVHSLLDELYFLDWKKIYKSTLARRQKNIKLFFSGNPVRPFGQELAKTMSRIDNKPYSYNDSSIVKYSGLIDNFKNKLML